MRESRENDDNREKRGIRIGLDSFCTRRISEVPPFSSMHYADTRVCGRAGGGRMLLAATCVCDGDIYGPIESALSRATWTKTSDGPGRERHGRWCGGTRVEPMDQLSRARMSARRHVYPHARACACPALFLRLQFELKKAVDTRTIGCAAAASSSPPPSSDLLGYFSLLPSLKTSYLFFYSFSLSLVLFLLSSSARWRRDWRFGWRCTSRGPRHALPLMETNAGSPFRP